MALLDIDQLLAPVSEADRAGPNLEYDPAFAALERAAEGRAEQVIGGVTTPAEPPDWGTVLEQGLGLFQRTKDLRVAVHLTRALLHRQGISGFAEGLGLMRGLLENYWETVHPGLDPDDDNDPTMRVSALSALTTPTMLHSLRTAPLVASRALGPLSMADMAPAEGTPDNGRIQGVFAEADLAVLEACAGALAAGSGHLRSMEGVFETNGRGVAPDLGPLLQYFHQARQAVEPRVAARRPSPEAAGSAAEGDGAAVVHARPPTDDILSREDVVRALEKIAAYYQRNEPSSPVPLLLERCKRLVTMSFLEILNELAPDGLKQVELATGKDGK
jgi:type VI secretion system protein ImpA